MIFWTIMFYIAVGSFLILTGLLIFRKYCKNYYYHSFIRDELLKEEKIGNGTNYIYSTSKENSDIIPRYIIRNSPYEKSIVLEYKEKYEYIEYYIKCYNSKNKVIEIYDVKEENTTNISKIISVDKNTQAINVFIKNVNHDVDINTSEIKPISRRNIHLYSLELSLNIFFLLFLLRQIILYFVLMDQYRPFLTSMWNYISLGILLVITIIMYIFTFFSLRRRNWKNMNRGAVRYDFY